MTDDKEPSGDAGQTAERIAIRKLGAVLNESLFKISEAEKSQLVAMAGLAALVASLPGVSQLDATKVGFMVGQLAKGRPDEEEFRQKVSLFAARVMSIAKAYEENPPTQSNGAAH